MDKIKEFISDHRKELIIGGGLIFAYKLGFNAGCKSTDKAVKKFIKEFNKTFSDLLYF